ncbi:geraniol 8-hydroxylase-like [Silene latifolia]|uniref:geraniol 8-hydroxylase-like n=1 Tax=Silene latifolia TaxID=37657 RepID=UPI003D77A97F
MVVDIGQAGFNVVLNVLSTTLCSLDLGDPSSEVSSSFRKTFREIIKEMGRANVSDFFPIMKKMDVQGIRQRMGVSAQKIFDVFNVIIEERLRNRCLPDYVRRDDVLDTLLDMKSEEGEYIEATAIPRLFLVSLCLPASPVVTELIVAGTDTTSSSFEWAMAELIQNPSKLKNLQAELEETIGKGNSVQECHITMLPYLQAIIKETFRLHPPVPIPVRKVESNVNMFAYTIPANSMVLLNV